MHVQHMPGFDGSDPAFKYTMAPQRGQLSQAGVPGRGDGWSLQFYASLDGGAQ